MTTENLPENVNLNLDAVERPAEDRVDPFKVVVGGRVITMTDPEEIDWQDLLTIEDPIQFLEFCVSEEDRDYLAEQKIPGWKFGHLIQGYQKHFKIDKKIAQAQREQARGGNGRRFG